MAVSNLHEAAKVLQSAHTAIEKVLGEVEPMVRAYLDRQFAGPLTDEEREAMMEESGYGPLWDAADHLRRLLGKVDDMEREEANARFFAS